MLVPGFSLAIDEQRMIEIQISFWSLDFGTFHAPNLWVFVLYDLRTEAVSFIY